MTVQYELVWLHLNFSGRLPSRALPWQFRWQEYELVWPRCIVVTEACFCVYRDEWGDETEPVDPATYTGNMQHNGTLLFLKQT